MAARGMGAPGSKYGYNTDLARNDSAAEATRQAYLASGAESRAAQEEYNKTAQADWQNQNNIVDQGNALRQAQTAEGEGVRNQNLNELAVLMGGGQATVPQAQGFQGSSVNPFNIAGAMQQNYQDQLSAYNAKLSGLASARAS
jgi:hypothetical protein